MGICSAEIFEVGRDVSKRSQFRNVERTSSSWGMNAGTDNIKSTRLPVTCHTSNFVGQFYTESRERLPRYSIFGIATFQHVVPFFRIQASGSYTCPRKFRPGYLEIPHRPFDPEAHAPRFICSPSAWTFDLLIVATDTLTENIRTPIFRREKKIPRRTLSMLFNIRL